MIEAEEIREVSQRALACVGVPSPHAVVQVDLLLEAELRGRPSHGLMRLPRIVQRIRNGVIEPRTTGATVVTATGRVAIGTAYSTTGGS